MTSLAKIYEIVDIACDRQERDQDWIMAICGGTGAGKSSALLWIYLRLCELKGLSPDNLDFFCTNIKEFASQFYLSPKSGFLILDEAGDKLSNDTYNSTFNKQLRATLSVVRKKRMIVIIALPYFGRLDTQIRCDRIDVCLQMLMTERGR
jgi:hypothetical protein